MGDWTDANTPSRAAPTRRTLRREDEEESDHAGGDWQDDDGNRDSSPLGGCSEKALCAPIMIPTLGAEEIGRAVRRRSGMLG